MNPNTKISFEVSPLEFRLTDAPKTKILLHVQNTTSKTIHPESYRFQLLVNDTASMVFMLRISNGIRPQAWSALPAGEQITEDLSSIAPRLFPHVGEYKLQLRWEGGAGDEFWVRVLE